MTIYEVEVYFYGLDWESFERFWFLSTEDAESFKESYHKEHLDDDGNYIPTIKSISFYINPHKYDDVKHILTISDYEYLFNTTIESNNKLSISELKDDMWVYNENKNVYQHLKLKLIDNTYIWTDDSGNIVDINDGLYKYKIYRRE